MSKEIRIKDFSEKDIRKAILNKVNPLIVTKGKHWSGSIYLDNKLISKVKIPNEHTKKVMKKSKSQFIAASLRLDNNQFNLLIECPLKGPEYYEIQRKKGY